MNAPGRPAVGFVLQPDREYLGLLEPLIREDCDLYEVAPETLWRLDREGNLQENGFHRFFLQLARDTGRPFVAHGVALSLGTADPADEPRFGRWLDRIRRDHEAFGFAWYTDHLGVTILGGRNLTLPLPLPPTLDAVARVRARLARLAEIVPEAGAETTVTYFLHGTPEQDAVFSRQIAGSEHWLLLDLHNVHTMSQNLGFDPRAWIRHLDLSRVIEIHISGGVDSPPGWLGERSIRLDSHDAEVPEAVWDLLAEFGPRCPALRAVVLERMEGTVGPGDVAGLRAEMARLRRLVSGWTPVLPEPPIPGPPLMPQIADPVGWERDLADRILNAEPASRDSDPDPGRDGERVAALLVARLRFERLLNGSDDAARRFEADPASFASDFRRYHRDVLPTALFPTDEAVRWRDWSAR